MIPGGVEPRIVNYLYSKASYLGIPLGGTFEVSPQCNMNCKMCYVRLSKEEQEAKGQLLTKEQWLSIAKAAKKAGMLFLLLTGGEPFYRNDFREIYESLYQMGFVISINSNGTLIDEATVEWLKKSPPSRINITLYGASNETYKELCRNPKGFTQVTNTIDLLKEAGIDVKLNCSLTPDNVKDLEEMIRYAESKELILDIAAYMFPTLRKTIKQENVKDRFTPQEAGYYCMKAGLLQYGEEAFLQFLKQENPKIPADQECRELEGEKMRCRGGRSSFWITWDGKMTGCGMMDRPFVYPMKEGFSQAWRNLQKKIDEIRLPVSCATCDKKEECGLCAAMVLAETDGFSEVPVYRCRMLDSYQENCRSMKNKLEKKKC